MRSIDPSLMPLQLMSVGIIMALRGTGSFTIMESLKTVPHESVPLTLYVPAINPSRSSGVLDPGLSQ